MTTIGVLGGGQLGRMMALAARRMGWSTIILDPDPDSPAGQVANRQIIGSFRDPAQIRALAAQCDVVTVEIEHIDADALAELEREGVRIQPAASALRVIQDKYAQKMHFAGVGIAVPSFANAPSQDAVRAFAAQHGYPVLLKAKRLAYDGRGNARIDAESEIEAAFSALGGRDLYVEAFVPFVKELAVMVARSTTGAAATYPVVETIQRENICHVVLAPAPVSLEAARNAESMAQAVATALDGAGVFGIELFLLDDDSVLFNEAAPRPHNSGHYTIEACVTSQFEQHLRAICGLPLGSTALKVGAAAMINLLGGENETETERTIAAAYAIPDASVHWYGKREYRRGRKLGHLTLVGKTLPALLPNVQALSALEMDVSSPVVVGIIMGSDSDLNVMKLAAQTLRDFGISFELTIVSAHRTPHRMVDYAKNAHMRGLRLLIAGAGGAAHLPGMVAALTPLPVIGVPVKLDTLEGLDSLLSIVQMPRGIPVATVAINNATNAALLAVRMLATHDPALQTRLLAYQQQLADRVLEKAARLAEVGWEAYSG